MKKIRWATHKSLFGQIATSSCLLAVSAGVIFGVSAATFKIEYMNLNDPQARLRSAAEHNYYSQNIKSQWNMFQQGTEGDENYIKGVDQPATSTVDAEWWSRVHQGTVQLNQKYNDIDPSKMQLEIAQGTAIGADAQKERTKYSALVIDGSTHTALDRSFNQGLYNGLANFNTNVQHDVVDNSEGQVFKPSQDSTQEFVNIYRAVAAKSRILALAGFNHVTPLNALGKRNADGIYEFTDKNIANSGMMLMDGDVSNNQNIASVLFRSDQPAFLAALATCMYFLNNLNIYHDRYQDISVAAYGGTAIPTVIVYMGGFQRGIEFFNRFILKDKILNDDGAAYITDSGTARSDYFEKKLLPASKYKDEVEELKNTPASQKGTVEFRKKKEAVLQNMFDEYSVKMIKLGDFGTHFSGSFAAGDAIGISKQFLNRGASAIIAVAGPQSLDTAQEVMNQNSKCIVIGVDSAMERSDYQKPFKNQAFKDQTVAASGDGTISAQAGNIIKFSAVKDMTNVSDSILRLAATGKHWDKNSITPWISAAVIPSWTENEEIPLNELNIEYNDTDKTFNVFGFNRSHHSLPVEKHVLNIPIRIKNESGTEYRLSNIYGFDVGDSAQADLLDNIDTFKISGETDGNDKITFGYIDPETRQVYHAFDYENWTTTGKKRPGIRYVDFTDIPCSQMSKAGATTNVFNCVCWTDEGRVECKVKDNGIVKFYKNGTNDEKKKAWNLLFAGVDGSDSTDGWAVVEPDPYSSICGFGFKTCGNIENGLISISWDGWPFLLEALKHCDFLSTDGSIPTPFSEIWIKMAKAYAWQHEGEIDEKFYNFLNGTKDINKYSTFDTESVLNKNYSHVMTILGKLLNECSMSFPSDMTILFDKESKPYLPTNATALTVLDWLKFNMYFTL